MQVKCPTCGRSVEWIESNPYRPFCNERCKLIDLGAWLSEEQRIAGESALGANDESANDDRAEDPS